MKRVYLDYASTTSVDPKIIEDMMPYLKDDFGNPSSPHYYGQKARKAIEDAREILANSISAQSEEIIFTSGATESNNLALFGVARALREKGKHILISSIEHHSVIRPAQELKSMGFDVSFIKVDRFGQIDPQDVKSVMTPQTILVAVMHASNEIGTIQPIKEIGMITKAHNVLFLVDACQTVGHLPVDVNELNCDFLSFSAHKFYGPKGVGGLYARKGSRLSAWLLGGDQERNRRASTHNVPGIVGMGKAIDVCRQQMPGEMQKQTQLRDRLIDFVINNIDGSRLNGHPSQRLPNNAHFSFEGVDGEALLMSLDMNGFCASMGSACTSGSLKPSDVLKAIGLSDALALGSLRVSLGRWTVQEEIDAFAHQLKKSVEQLRQ